MSKNVKERIRAGSKDTSYLSVVLHHPKMDPTAPAAGLGSGVWEAVDDPDLRQVVDLRGCDSVKIHGRLSGTICNDNKIRVQYNVSDVAADTAGKWHTLATSRGQHTLDEMFWTSGRSVPDDAQIENCILRAGIYDGDGVADPQISCCILSFSLGDE